MSYSRREVCTLLAALAATPAAHASPPDAALPSKAFPYDQLPVREHNGNQGRPILQGQLHDGFTLEVHETRLPPGAMPHPAHHHLHEEMFLIREGTLEFTVNGQATRFGPGSVGYVASNDEHGIKNVGDTPAEYFVVELGKDA